MEQEVTAEQVQEKLLKVRREQGISETVSPIRSIVKKQSTEKYVRPTVCSIHNEPYNEHWQCSKCIEVEIEHEKRFEREEKEYEEKIAKGIAYNPGIVLEKIGIGPRHIGCSFENYQNGEKVKNICKDVVKTPCDLVLTGPAGTGKTHLAVAIFRELVRNRTIKVEPERWSGEWIRSAWFITVPDLLLLIRQAFNNDNDFTEADVVNKFAKVKYLLLDDLGAEKTTEWSITTLYTIIDQRYRNMRPTIVTTNLTIDQIGSQISDRIASRLSSGKIIKINAPDYRKKRG